VLQLLQWPLSADDLQQTIAQHARVRNSVGTAGPWTSGNPACKSSKFRRHFGPLDEWESSSWPWGSWVVSHRFYYIPSPVLDAPTNLRVLVWNGLDRVSIRCGSRSGRVGKKNVERKNIMCMDGYAHFLL
jgi:hypothetical protein